MTLAEQIQNLLDDLSTTLSEIEASQSAKRSALASIDSQALLDQSEIESRLAAALAHHAQKRANLAREASLSISSLDDLASVAPTDQQPGLRQRIQKIRAQTRAIKEQLAVNWLSAWRVNQYVGELLRIMTGALKGAGQASRQGLCIDSTA